MGAGHWCHFEIESRVAFVAGYFGVPIIFVLTNGGLSVEEVVRLLEFQSLFWVFASMKR